MGCPEILCEHEFVRQKQKNKKIKTIPLNKNFSLKFDMTKATFAY